MAGVDIGRIADLVRSTRATEFMRGSWLDLVAQLRGYPLTSRLFARRVEKSTDRIKWRVAIDQNPGLQSNITGFHVGAYSTVQTAGQENLKELDIKLCKVRKAMAISKDEIVMNQGSGDEQLLDLYQEKLVHSLDFPLMSLLEYALAGTTSAVAPSIQETTGLRYWLPADLQATDLEMNGGGNPVAGSGAQGYYNSSGTAVGSEVTTGAANLTVAAAPRWAHAVCGFDKVSDDDLFGKLWEFGLRCNKFVPEGAMTFNTAGSNRLVLCQTPVMKAWVHLQVVANDNPGSDLGRMRDQVMFMSTPVETLPVIDTPSSPLYTGNATNAHGVLYDLDLDSFKYQIHPEWNFALEEDTKDSTPDVKVLYRQAYQQLACIDRSKNLVAATDNSALYSIS